MADAINSYGKKFGIDTEEELSHFLGQIGKESAGLNLFRELSSYSVEGLLKEWPFRFSLTDASLLDPNDYARNGEKLFNEVYASRNGNGNPSTGDGYKYRGRGLIQITGKEKYRSFTSYYQNEINSTKDFVLNPDLVSNDITIATIATIASMWYWQRDIATKVDTFDDSDKSIKQVTLKVRNTTSSWTERKAFYEEAKNEIDCIN